ncbi:MAG: RNA polymerase sigma factor [Gemmataceae bacterium]
MAGRGTNPSVHPTPTAAPPESRPAVPAAHPLVTVFDSLRDELVSTLVYLLGNRDDAQDAAQETFLKCWRAQASLEGVQNVRAWIFRVAMNTARDHRRSAWSRRVRPLVGEELMLASRDDPPVDDLERQESLARLREAITQLRPEEREVFLLRQNGELTYEEIAEVRQAPVGTVKTHMRSALIKLRKVLNPGGPADPDS